MAVALYLAPEKTPLWVIMGLLCMAALATHPVLHLHWVTKAASGKSRAIRSLTAFSGMAGLVGLYGWFVWPLSHRHELNQRERSAFEQPLKQQKEPREEIQIACPQAEESTCVYAAQFINLFREAGWKVQGNAVQRGALGAPLAGVILVKHGTGTIDPSNWRSGLWTQMSPSFENVRQAFINVGIEPDSIADQALSENVIRVYFGSEKPNQAERTPLTDMMQRVERERRNGTIPKSQ